MTAICRAIPGQRITAQNARGTDMLFRYEQNVESEDGKYCVSYN